MLQMWPGAVLLTPVPYLGLWHPWMLFRRRPWLVLKAIFTLKLYPVFETSKIAHENLFTDDFPEGLVKKYQKQMKKESSRSYLDELGLNLVRPKRVKASM